MYVALTRIVSGGQTGVDRGALDAALAAGFPCGGWCPAARMAEDGRIAAHYPLAELPGAGYAERTLRNVLDSDGTAIIHRGVLEGGTRSTLEHCLACGRPHVVIDGGELSVQEAARAVSAFVVRQDISVLNVAGPRASKWPGAHDYAYEVVGWLLQSAPAQGVG